LIKISSFILIVSILCLSGCEKSVPDNIIRFALSNAPSNLDPRFATDATSERINHLLYSHLIKFDKNLLPIPSLASWEKIDNKTYRFNLLANRPKFSNGKKIKARDVVASYAYILNKENLSPHRESISLINSVKALDEETIEFTLSKSDPLFPAYMKIAILPESLILNHHNFNDEPVGSGSFILSQKDSSVKMTIERRSDQQKIQLLQVKEVTVRVMKLLNGEVDLLQNDLSPEIVSYLKDNERISHIKKEGNNFSYIGFNLQDSKTGKHNIRKAISHAIDRQAIIHYVFNGSARPAESILPKEHWAGSQSLKSIIFNPVLAKQLLADEGYDANNRLELTYKTSSDPFRIKLATIIQSQLEEVGIDLIIKSYDWGTFFGDIKAGRFQMYSLAWVGINTPDIFNYVFHSKSIPPVGANRGRYASDEVDSLLNKVSAYNELNLQKPSYDKVQQQVHEDLPYIPLWYEHQQAFLSHRISDYSLSANGNYDALKEVKLVSSH